MWKIYALLSAVFAALTAILAKVGVRGINGNVATAVRTGVVLLLAWGIVLFGGQLRLVKDLSRTNIITLILSAFIFLGEPMSVKTIAGGLLITAGTVLLAL